MKLKQNNNFISDLCNLMNNNVFKSFYKKYCNTWLNVNTIIMYMKLYEIIEISYYNKFNKKITQKEMLKYNDAYNATSIILLKIQY